MNSPSIWTIGGLLANIVGAILLAIQNRWYVVGSAAFASEGEMIFWGGWALMIAGFALQLAGQYSREE